MSPKKRGKRPSGSDPHREREEKKYNRPVASREFITAVLTKEKGPVGFEALADKLGISDDAELMEGLRRRVGAMLRDGQLIQNRRRGLVPVDTDALIAGRISAHPDGFGFVIADDGDKDVYLNGKQMRQVLHGDRVVVCITGMDHRGRREGRIVDVVERANKSLVGRLSIDRGTVVVLPDNKRIHQDLLIAPGELADAQDGDMVVAEIVEQPSRRHQPVGKVVEVLGQHLRPGMEIDVALHSHGIPVTWPEGVTEQAAAFSTVVDAAAAKGRKDVRHLPLVTIDGADARDFDDAVWCEKLESGWRLMVAIADVAHYVKPGAALDAEAVSRGTSVYFPGRVVPMLPEVLSNGLCSLNPDVDRLCMLCEMTLNAQGEVSKTRFHNGILRSHARLTYDQVFEMLTDEKSTLRTKHEPILPMIEELHKLYETLAKRRRKRGAIEFDSTETHILFDDNKKIKEIVPIVRNDAHKLIEECMILANIEAAAYLEKHEVPALYRVHSGPKADRLEDLRAFLSLRSLNLGGGEQPTALDYAALAEQISDRPDRGVIQTVMLRSMQQAVYQPNNEGHFGLALSQYAHFTSPIRRYPDLLVHRAIKHVLTRAKPAAYLYSKEVMQGLGESCSMTERRAEDASRDVVSWLKCEYMQEHVGAEYSGVVSAVTSFGLFVELVGIHVEGLVHITNLSHDYYRFDQAAQALNGERTGRQYHLGDAITVCVAAVNLEERKIDFLEVVTKGVEAKGRRVALEAGQKSGKRTEHQPPVADKKRKKRKKKRRTEVEAQAKTAGLESVVSSGDKAASASAEARRQKRRKLKQERRDKKRKALRAAKKLALQSADQGTAATQKITGEQTSPVKERGNRKPVRKQAAVDGGEFGANVAKEGLSQAGGKVAKKAVSNAGGKVAKKAVSKAGGKVAKKVVSQAAGKVAKKAVSQAAGKVAKKAVSQTAGKVAKKVASKAGGKVAKKVVSKAAGKVAKKVASKAGGKVAKKVASKAGGKVAKKAVSKATGKVAKKAVSKAAGKVAKKAVSKATGKVAKKAVSKAAGKVAKKAVNKAAGKVTKKAVSKGAAKVAKKAVSKATGKVAKKAVSKAVGKVAKKAVGKARSKVVKKAASKAAAKVAKNQQTKSNKKKVANKTAKVSKNAKSTGTAKIRSKSTAKNVAKKRSKGKVVSKKRVGKKSGS